MGKAAESLGFEVFSSDVNDFEDINYAVDILNFDINKIPFTPDVIWASPPCTYFSVASIGKHWNKDHTPKSENASPRVLGFIEEPKNSRSLPFSV